MATTKKKSVEEKIRELDTSSSRKFSQEFVSFFEEQKQVLQEVENLFKEKYDITGRGRVIGILCRYFLSETQTQEDGKE